MNNKFLTLLGFAAKAGKLFYGMNAAVSSVYSNKAVLVLVCCDISDKSKKEIAYHCSKFNAEVIILGDYDIQAVSNAVGRKCGIISIADSSFAKAMKNALTQGGNA